MLRRPCIGAMPKLSPAAQAVLDAFLNGYMEAPYSGRDFNEDCHGLAAALRAAANEILPTDSDWHEAFVRLATELEN